MKALLSNTGIFNKHFCSARQSGPYEANLATEWRGNWTVININCSAKNRAAQKNSSRRLCAGDEKHALFIGASESRAEKWAVRVPSAFLAAAERWRRPRRPRRRDRYQCRSGKRAGAPKKVYHARKQRRRRAILTATHRSGRSVSFHVPREVACRAFFFTLFTLSGPFLKCPPPLSRGRKTRPAPSDALGFSLIGAR